MGLGRAVVSLAAGKDFCWEIEAAGGERVAAAGTGGGFWSLLINESRRRRSWLPTRLCPHPLGKRRVPPGSETGRKGTFICLRRLLHPRDPAAGGGVGGGAFAPGLGRVTLGDQVPKKPPLGRSSGFCRDLEPSRCLLATSVALSLAASGINPINPSFSQLFPAGELMFNWVEVTQLLVPGSSPKLAF